MTFLDFKCMNNCLTYEYLLYYYTTGCMALQLQRSARIRLVCSCLLTPVLIHRGFKNLWLIKNGSVIAVLVGIKRIIPGLLLPPFLSVLLSLCCFLFILPLFPRCSVSHHPIILCCVPLSR